MAAGQQWPLENAMASLLMASANDAAYAMAETAGGSLDGFIAAMEQSGQRLGMKDSTFADPAGLDDKASYKGGPRMSAYDIAIATRNAMAVPEIAKYAGLRTFKFDDPTGLHRSLTNHNKLLPGSSHAYQWATGFKTGYTERAGHTITATATRDGRSLIAVIMNTYDTYGWAAQLFEQGFGMANAAGTGTRLPRVAVSTYDQRIADRDAFSTLVRGASLTSATRPDSTPTSTAPPSSTSSSPSSSTSSSAPATTAEPPSSVVGGSTIASQQAAAGGGGSGLLDVRNVVIVVLILLVIGFVLRRRAVRRQRARRIARQRNRAAKMRSGGLTVVDGRYRPGDRIGPPVESHVRLRRDDE
jgi:D-alanyl-D-alanine carboxypeptidase